MTQNELILYVKDRIKTIAPGDDKISGALLQEVLLSMIVNMPSTAGDSNLATKAFAFTNDDLDGSFAITFEHNLSTVIPGIMVFNHLGEPIGEAHYTPAVVDANNASLTFYEALPTGATYKVVFVYYLSDVPSPGDDYIEYFEESFSLFTGEQYQETPYGWSVINSLGETFDEDYALSEDNGTLNIIWDKGFAGVGLHTLGIKYGKKLKVNETYRFTFDFKATTVPYSNIQIGMGNAGAISYGGGENAYFFLPTSTNWGSYSVDVPISEEGNFSIFIVQNLNQESLDSLYFDNLTVEKIS